jgi:hypothetical protein
VQLAAMTNRSLQLAKAGVLAFEERTRTVGLESQAARARLFG